MKWNLKKVKVSDLKENPNNPRKLTEKGLKDLEKSITKFGIAEPLVCNTDLMICGGHGRKKILERLNIAEVDCYLPGKKLTQKQFDELGIRLNKNIAGEFDFDILANEFEVEELIEWGFEEKELDLNLWNDIDESKLDEVPEIPKKAISMLGDLFEIDGKHRVMCGDSTKAEDVEKLMDGKKADMVFTDPPYGVGYQDLKKRFNKIKGDEIGTDVSSLLCNILILDCPLFICCNWKSYSEFEISMKSHGKEPKSCIVWDKEYGVQNLDKYFKQHEFILYYGLFGGQKTLRGDVWKFKREVSKDHPTAKPVKLITTAIEDTILPKNIVLDLFLGSGSTLIACQQTNRICYGMELDPIYIDVILKRYKKLYPDAVFKCLNRKFDFDKLFKE